MLIVGAGPIGMTAALVLARYGIRSVLIDRKDTFNDGSRAICIARPSMHILERIGAVAPFVEKALGWRFGRSYYRGEQIFRLEMPQPPGEKYLPMYNLQQQYIEKFLHDAVAASDLIDMRWQSELVGHRAPQRWRIGPDFIAGGRLSARCRLCAGRRRRALAGPIDARLAAEGRQLRRPVCDRGYPHGSRFSDRAPRLFRTSGNPGGTVLIHKQPDDIWRVDYQLREGESEADALKEENIRARVGAILADIGHTKPWELEWWSVYSANTLCLDDYRHGRVFFIGDAAHIVPIFGVRGLNNGLADAENIGWKLALVLHGEADERLLDSYSPERRGATLDVFANATKSTRFMTPPTRGWRLAREAALSLSLKHEFPRGLANPRQMQPYTYSESPLTPYAGRDAEFAGGPALRQRRAERRARRRQLSAGSRRQRHDGDPVLRGATHRANRRRCSRNSAGSTSALFRCWSRQAARPPKRKPLRIVTAKSPACSRPQPGTLYLLRPDLHIAGRWKAVVPGEILKTAGLCLGSETP